MIDASKYIYSKGTHYISNTGHDENGRYHGGKAGDQGGEYTLRPWYDRPWTCILRYPLPQVGMLIAELACAAAQNNNIGYDQYERTSYWTQLQKADYDPSAIKTKCETDCTASTVANVKAAGHIMGIKALEGIPIDTYSGNMRNRFVNAGFKALTDSKYLSSPAYLLPGDVLLYEGHHACINVTYGSRVNQITSEPRALRHGMTGDDVRELQRRLINLGYSCGSYGADGDFGDATELAVKHFQRAHGLTADGIAGKQTMDAITAAEQSKPTNPKQVTIVGGNCYLRNEPSTAGKILGVVHEGALLMYLGETSENGWLKVGDEGLTGWVSGKYGRLV